MLVLFFYILLFIVFYTYVGYGILLWVMVAMKSLFFKSKAFALPTAYPDITLLIAAYNEADLVEEKMANCDALDYPSEHLHIWWVTDGSDDATNEKLRLYPHVKVLYQPIREGKTMALNRAMKEVTDSFVCFNDANAMLNREAIKEMIARFSDPKVGCVSGEKRVVSGSLDSASSSGEGFYWRYESWLKQLDSTLYSVVGSAGELFAIRTELFEVLPKDTLLDDFMLSMRITQRGYKNAYCPTAYATEGGALNMEEEEKRKVRIAAGGLQSIWRLRSLLNIFRYGTLSFQYISHRVLRWSITPVAFFLLLPLNIALCYLVRTPIYYLFLLFQLLFYLSGLMGYLMAKRQLKCKVLFIPYYFLFMNINVFKGFFYLCKKRTDGAWEKSKRK